MKKIMLFCIPAHGHTNPMLAVAAALVRRGNAVRFYSFSQFEEKIRAAGAEYISCDRFLQELSAREEAALKEVSTTEMTLQDLRITKNMTDFLDSEYAEFRPDAVYTDSVCFWGKLSAWKYKVPMVVSTSTFAFNQLSSGYMKNSPKEIFGLIAGLPRIKRELNTLEPLGYHVRSVLSLVQSDNQTDSVVYTSKRMQPCAASFSAHYAFVGPSLQTNTLPQKNAERPLVYISMGTVINDRPDFYKSCIEALRELPVDVIISCGDAVDPQSLGALPENVQVFPHVDQVELLAKTSVFITHCGMNSVSESLFMAAPMVLFPQTNEQRAVARRVTELGAGLLLGDDSAEGIRNAVQKILQEKQYTEAAAECSADLRACPGAEGAAEFIEQAPHQAEDDPLARINAKAGKYRLLYWAAAAVLAVLIGIFIGKSRFWIAFAAAGIFRGPFDQAVMRKVYREVTGEETTPDSL